MTQEFDGDFIEDVFDDYLQVTTVRIKPPGTAAAILAVRKRRRRRAFVVAFVAVLVLVLPVAAYALVVRPFAAPDTITPSISPAVSTPSAAAMASSTPSGSVPYFPGGFTLDELKNATITVPAWQDTAFKGQDCPSGKITFANGSAQDRVDLTISKSSYVDINLDGSYETIVLLSCRGGQVGPMQVIVVGREGTGIKTFGQVISTRNGIGQIVGDGILGTAIHTVAVPVRNGASCCDTPLASVQEQVRYYKWNGTKFEQNFGTTDFYPPATETDLAITVPDVVFGKPVDGLRTAKVRFIVTNNGPADVDQVLLRLTLAQANAAKAAEGWTLSRVVSQPGTVPLFIHERYLPAMRAGERYELEASITTPVASPTEISVRPMVRPAKSNGDLLADRAPFSNECRDASEVKVSFS